MTSSASGMFNSVKDSVRWCLLRNRGRRRKCPGDRGVRPNDAGSANYTEHRAAATPAVSFAKPFCVNRVIPRSAVHRLSMHI
jgi:hypothetical protein